METIYLGNIREIRRWKEDLEKKLNVRIEINGRRVRFYGDSVSEYDASRVFEAMDFGFSAKKSLFLIEEDVVFRRVHIRSHTKKSLDSVRARLIGTHGKTRKTMSEISGCEILVKEGEVGIIGEVAHAEDVERAIIHLIEGSKQGNMYKYLERMNRERKEKLDLD